MPSPNNLTKVGVEGSNPFARSRFPQEIGALEVAVIGVDPLDMAGLAQRLQTPHIGPDEHLGVAAQPIDGGARALQMDGGAIALWLALAVDH